MCLRSNYIVIIKTAVLLLLTPLLLTASFPQHDFSFLGWIALIPLIIIILTVRWHKSFILSWICGVVTFMGIFSWILQVEGFSLGHYLLLGLYLGIYFALFGLLVHIFDQKKMTYPLYMALIWVLLEYLRSHFSFLALPWALLGHTQYKNLNLIQCASFTGVYGISFLMVLVNASLALFLYRIFRSRGKSSNKIECLVLWPLLLVFFISLWGKNICNNANLCRKVRVGLVQGNIPQDIKWEKKMLSLTIDTYEKLTKEVATQKPSLILWPETSIPIDFHSYPTKLWRILRLTKSIKIPLVCGAAGRAKIGRAGHKSDGIYNSAFYISALGGVPEEYRKNKLLPFNEYVPSVGGIPLSVFSPTLKSRFLIGEKVKVFSLDKENFGITICWENIFPDYFRRFIIEGASFMVNISNDGWFKDSAGPYQHLMCSVFRAVENRISIARAANTGISCFIDPFGKIIRKVTDERGKDVGITGIASEDIPIFRERTFYTHHGDIFIFICSGLLMLSCIWRIVRWKIKHN
ncbi:MAG: apolipoprotein N-acyltransferase [bacterium]